MRGQTTFRVRHRTIVPLDPGSGTLGDRYCLRALVLQPWTVWLWSRLAELLVIGAGLQGASFLDFNGDISSLLMALFAFRAAVSYPLRLFRLY